MKIIYGTLFLFFCLITGAFFFAFQQEWIIMRLPWHAQASLYTIPGVSKQKISIYYPSQSQLKEESKELILAQDQEKKTAALLAAWLTHLREEKIIVQNVTLQSALFDPSGTKLYVSFDQSFLPANQSVRTQWMLVQSLMKTLHENGIQFSGLYVLVNHAPMQDDHLDFSNAVNVA